ncbi:NAD(P)H-binding protein [Virgisporangium ochraceum]|uniref:NmrA family transcriptional regulator n=1 Tax=Virgisporangium ochraceum TaxID=65505 RepID=A0A8J4A1V0_9ACTN|nr:NAD(P)H-binding protein [Virgisporangium ochraceum]GIJ74224.1 NmrA family transcriptional regulator [Virgisporangium ochraceum]
MTTLVIGGTGKTGRRVAQKLADRGAAVRIGSRAGSPPFDWEDLTTWEPAVRDVTAVYLTYQPDLAFPGAAEQIGAFAKLAVAAGTRRIVLLSGRGEEETWPSEESVRTSGADWTILRCNWFAQNFSESFLHPGVMEGVVALPSPDVPEPFIDVADIAEVAVAALTSDDHSGRLYELSGPRAITFAEATAEISAASGREVRYQPVSVDEYAAAAVEFVGPEAAPSVAALFAKVLDGRNSAVTPDLERVLGRPGRDFRDVVREAAAAGAWS